MEYTSQLELYRALLPAFNVKKRLLSITECKVTNEDIWQYLIITKWKHCRNLTIAEIVNDIIILDVKKIINLKGVQK